MSLAAECAILGAILINPALISEVAVSVRPGDFTGPAHGRIFSAMLKAQSKGSIDPVTVRIEDPSIPAEQIAGLMDGVPRITGVEAWCQIVRNAAILRELRMAGERIARTGEIPAEEGITEAYRTLTAASMRASSRALRSPEEVAKATFVEMEMMAQAKEGIVGLATGITEFDMATRGLRPGKLYVFAGRPAAGKTAAAMTIADNVSDAGGGVQFFSLEMRAEELTERRFQKRSRVSLWGLRTGPAYDDQWAKITRVTDGISTEPFFIDDSPDVPLAYIRAISHQAKTARGIDLIVVDYLQLVKGSGRKEDGRQQEVAEVARGLKNLARELDLPVVALSQLNRESEHAKEKRPTMSQLRESGEIENAADVIVLLHRPWVYNQNANPEEAQWIIAKHRGGPTTTIDVKYQATLTTFTNPGL